MESLVDLLISRLRRDVTEAGNNDLDIAKYYGYATLDIMGELCLANLFHSLEGDNEHSWIMGLFIGARFGSPKCKVKENNFDLFIFLNI